MKRGVVLILEVLIVIGMLGVVNAFGVDEYAFTTSNFNCKDFGLECGNAHIYNPEFTGELKSCGVCSGDNFCFFGKCVNNTLLGTCTRSGEIAKEDCTSFFFNVAYDTPGLTKQQLIEKYQNTCIEQGCQSYNPETRTCIGSLSACSFSNDSGGVFCVGAGCKFANIDKYVPKIILFYSEDRIISPRETIMNYQPPRVYLNISDLERLEYGAKISVLIELNNSGLPMGTPIRFEIFGLNNSVPTVIPDIKIKTINSLIDEQGRAIEDLSLSKDDLLKVDYYKLGNAYFTINVIVNDVPLINPMRGDFVIYSTTGKCSGTSTCSSYNEGQCHTYQVFGGLDCSWNLQTNSCQGTGGISCSSSDLQSKNSCNFFPGCSWKADSFWERFIDLIKGIFGM